MEKNKYKNKFIELFGQPTQDDNKRFKFELSIIPRKKEEREIYKKKEEHIISSSVYRKYMYTSVSKEEIQRIIEDRIEKNRKKEQARLQNNPISLELQSLTDEERAWYKVIEWRTRINDIENKKKNIWDNAKVLDVLIKLLYDTQVCDVNEKLLKRFFVDHGQKNNMSSNKQNEFAMANLFHDIHKKLLPTVHIDKSRRTLRGYEEYKCSCGFEYQIDSSG